MKLDAANKRKQVIMEAKVNFAFLEFPRENVNGSVRADKWPSIQRSQRSLTVAAYDINV